MSILHNRERCHCCQMSSFYRAFQTRSMTVERHSQEHSQMIERHSALSSSTSRLSLSISRKDCSSYSSPNMRFLQPGFTNRTVRRSRPFPLDVFSHLSIRASFSSVNRTHSRLVVLIDRFSLPLQRNFSASLAGNLLNSPINLPFRLLVVASANYFSLVSFLLFSIESLLLGLNWSSR